VRQVGLVGKTINGSSRFPYPTYRTYLTTRHQPGMRLKPRIHPFVGR